MNGSADRRDKSVRRPKRCPARTGELQCQRNEHWPADPWHRAERADPILIDGVPTAQIVSWTSS